MPTTPKHVTLVIVMGPDQKPRIQNGNDEDEVWKNHRLRWVSDPNHLHWIVLMKGNTPFNNGMKLIARRPGGDGSNGGTVRRGSTGEVMEYWLYLEGADGMVGVDPKIVIREDDRLFPDQLVSIAATTADNLNEIAADLSAELEAEAQALNSAAQQLAQRMRDAGPAQS